MGTFIRIFLASMCFVLCVFYLDASYLKGWPFHGWSRESIGQFGDSWGFVTSIFSVAAFFGVLISISFQNKALKHSEEMTKRQTETLNLQGFEGNLFQMLNIFQSIIQDMDINNKQTKHVVYSGRDVFYYMYERKFKEICSVNIVDGLNAEVMKERLNENFDALFNIRQQELGHYLRFLYSIFRYIDTASISEEKKFFYGRIVRAQLSNFELYTIFYNCFSTYGRSFVKYAEKFELFDNLHIPGLVLYQHCHLIKKTAFGDNPYIDDKL